MWNHVRDHRLGVHIRRQHVLLGHFIADFYCASARLCIEVDGDTHGDVDQAKYDSARTEWLALHGLRVIRFTNEQVMRELPAVLAAIEGACGLVEDE